MLCFSPKCCSFSAHLSSWQRWVQVQKITSPAAFIKSQILRISWQPERLKGKYDLKYPGAGIPIDLLQVQIHLDTLMCSTAKIIRTQINYELFWGGSLGFLSLRTWLMPWECMVGILNFMGIVGRAWPAGKHPHSCSLTLLQDRENTKVKQDNLCIEIKTI